MSIWLFLIISNLHHYTDFIVGAVLLTGEWGCEKTYLMDTEMKEALKDKAHEQNG